MIRRRKKRGYKHKRPLLSSGHGVTLGWSCRYSFSTAETPSASVGTLSPTEQQRAGGDATGDTAVERGVGGASARDIRRPTSRILRDEIETTSTTGPGDETAAESPTECVACGPLSSRYRGRVEVVPLTRPMLPAVWGESPNTPLPRPNTHPQECPALGRAQSREAANGG